MLHQLKFLNKSSQFLRILQVDQLIYLFCRSLYSGLVGDALQADFSPLELELQPWFIRIACGIKDHRLEIKPDAVREEEAGGGCEKD